MAALERRMIVEALAATGSQRDAAALLGLRPTTLNEKMKRLGIERPLVSRRLPARPATAEEPRGAQ